jgi:hypothetical protein
MTSQNLQPAPPEKTIAISSVRNVWSELTHAQCHRAKVYLARSIAKVTAAPALVTVNRRGDLSPFHIKVIYIRPHRTIFRIPKRINFFARAIKFV